MHAPPAKEMKPRPSSDRMRLLPLLVLPLLMASAAQAQLLADPAGDTAADHFGQSRTPVQGWDSVDMLALTLEERPDAIRFTLQATKMEEGMGHDHGLYLIRMRHGEQWYTLQFLQSDNGSPFGFLRQSTETSPWGSALGTVDAAIDAAAGTIWGDVPRHLLVDERGSPPGRGTALESIHVLSSATLTNADFTGVGPLTGGPATISDRMPDDPAAAGTWPFQYGGGVANGPLRLDVEPPFRVSNGEATTFVMEVAVTNSHDAERTFLLTTPGLPSNWQASAGGDRLKIPAGGSVSFPFFLTVPFAHEHGSVISFELHLHAADDPEVYAAEQVGIHYHTVPQPAGHHPKLYLHSSIWSGLAATINPPLGGTNGVLYMNTVEEDAADQRQSIRGFSNLVSDQQTYRWAACLQPELAMGIDFDLAGAGSLELALKTTEPVEGTLTGRLLWIGPGEPYFWCTPYAYQDREQIAVATLTDTPVSLGATGEALVTVPITPLPEGDRIPWQSGANLVIEFEVTSNAPAGLGGAAGVDVLPGSWMELPLEEFHDALPAILSNGTAAPDPSGVFEPGDEAGGKESPLPVVAGLAAVAVAVLVRRRR